MQNNANSRTHSTQKHSWMLCEYINSWSAAQCAAYNKYVNSNLYIYPITVRPLASKMQKGLWQPREIFYFGFSLVCDSQLIAELNNTTIDTNCNQKLITQPCWSSIILSACLNLSVSNLITNPTTIQSSTSELKRKFINSQGVFKQENLVNRLCCNAPLFLALPR